MQPIKRIPREQVPPRFTDNDFWRNEIQYMRVLMFKHRDKAKEIVQKEFPLTPDAAKV